MNNIPGNASQQPADAGKEDYLDKGLDAAEKKFGGSMGQDTQKNRAVNEKIVCSRTVLGRVLILTRYTD